MSNEILKQIIEQIRKYELTASFSDIEGFKKWASKLDKVQIKNFLGLDIDIEEIRELRHLLIDKDLLRCIDYKYKVNAISKLKNGEGCWDLFEAICTPIFLKSKNFYKDIEMLSKAQTARYGLWIIGLESFINSPYHDEDLKLLVETRDTSEVVLEAIVTVAANIDSIRSPYHQADMKLIATVSSDCLQSNCSYPEEGLNNLAINKVSLDDKYHLENMQILAENPIASEFLYKIMTDPRFVNGKYYRKEVQALVNAKSKKTARALYYYIVNPEEKYLSDFDFVREGGCDIRDAYIYDKNSVAGNNDPDYLENLIKINKMDDKFVMHFVALLMNSEFINSPHKNFDIELLQSISNKAIFMDLYKLMNNVSFLNSKYHQQDASMVGQTTHDGVRDLLLQKACKRYSINSVNHESDMEFISKLQLESIPQRIYLEIYYYLFWPKGIDDPKRQEKLEKLVKGEFVERGSDVPNYLDILEQQIDDGCSEIIESTLATDYNKPKTRILSLFKSKKRK